MPSLGTHMHYCIELSIDTVNEHNNICKQIPVMGNVKTHIVPGFRSEKLHTFILIRFEK